VYLIKIYASQFLKRNTFKKYLKILKVFKNKCFEIKKKKSILSRTLMEIEIEKNKRVKHLKKKSIFGQTLMEIVCS
jgi:hypothetical protein